MYKHIFGPVPSRRLGISLGIDLVPHKVCSLNCVYCECGATTNLTLERKEYVPYDEVVSELEHYLENNPDPDYITFSGSGEPTLNSRMGEVNDFIKDNYPEIPVAVLTNGTLLPREDVRRELLRADLVIPSLDAALDRSFRKINRPRHELDIDEYIEGLVKFRQEFSGRIHLEVFILENYNDSDEDIEALKNAIKKIKPDLVQLNTLDRPGVVPGLKPAPEEKLSEIIDRWDMGNVDIIAKYRQRKKIQSYRKDVEAAILETIKRRQCTVQDLAEILNLHENEINKYLDSLEKEGKIESVQRERGVFYQTERNT